MTISKSSIGSLVSSAVTIVCGAVDVESTESIESIILLTIGIISAIISLGFNIWSWYVKAKSDGKITSDEIDELNKTVKTGTDDVKNAIEDKTSKNNGKEVK